MEDETTDSMKNVARLSLLSALELAVGSGVVAFVALSRISYDCFPRIIESDLGHWCTVQESVGWPFAVAELSYKGGGLGVCAWGPEDLLSYTLVWPAIVADSVIYLSFGALVAGAFRRLLNTRQTGATVTTADAHGT